MAEQNTSQPWGRIIGLLTAALVTLIGIVSGFEPFVILQRAVCASLLVGGGAWLMSVAIGNVTKT